WDTLEDKEIELALDYAVLRYLKRHNRLPENITDVFASDVAMSAKKTLAMSWINSE
ncbi:unnamed protein product, partial [marine sediment metagenome]